MPATCLRRLPQHELQRPLHQVGNAVALRGLEFEHHLPGGVGLCALVGKCRAGDVPARLLQRLAVVGTAVSLVGLEPGLTKQVPRDDAVHHPELSLQKLLGPGTEAR